MFCINNAGVLDTLTPKKVKNSPPPYYIFHEICVKKKGDRLYQKICDWPFVLPHVMEYLAARILFLYANIMKEK